MPVKEDDSTELSKIANEVFTPAKQPNEAQAEETKSVVAADNQLDQSDIITQLRDENHRLSAELSKAVEEKTAAQEFIQRQ